MNKFIIAALVSAVFSGQALAGFEIVDDGFAAGDADVKGHAGVKPVKAAVKKAVVESTVPLVFYIGEPSANPKKISGFGNDVTSDVALRQIVSFPGWHATREKGLDLSQKVSWKGGARWPEVVASIMEQSGHVAEINWTKRTIYVGSAQVTPGAKLAFAGKTVAEKESDDTETGNGAVEGESSWQIKVADRTARNTMLRWTKAAGWQLQWLLESDYEIKAEAEIVGSFEDALRRFSKNIGLEVTMYRGNKVVVVRERSN